MISNIQSVKEALKTWLQTKVRIDSFDLDTPDNLYSDSSTENIPNKAANTAIIYPVENLAYISKGYNSIMGEGTFPISIIYRYPADFSYHELPISSLESLVEYIQGSALLNGVGSCSIKSISPEATQAPVNPRRDGSDQDDWLIYCNFSFNIEFNVNSIEVPPEFSNEPDTDPINYPIDLGIKVYKSPIPLDPDNSTLDTELNFPNINNG